jgi:hypothetical protein
LTTPRREILQALVRMKPEELRRKAEPYLSRFVCQAWCILEPGRPFYLNWHIECIAEYLTDVVRGSMRRLIINRTFASRLSTAR